MFKNMSQAYKTQIKIRFHKADPAKILFFGNLLGLCHDLYEDFLQDIGIPWEDYFENPDYLIPIRHTECDFFRPLPAGENFDVEIRLSQLGETSFEFSYNFLKNEQSHAQAKKAHVFVNAQTKTKTPIPGWFREKIKPYLSPKDSE